MVFDCGNKRIKCAIADEDCTIVSMESFAPEVIISEDGFGRTCNHKTYWNQLIVLAEKTIKNSGINPKDLQFISASSIRPSCVFADENNNALYIGASFDARGIDLADEIEDKFEELTNYSFYDATGHFPSLLFPAARYAWILENPDCLQSDKKIAQYLPLESWILVKFGGEVHTNYTSAVESCFFDLKNNCWHEAWYKIFDLPDYFFPIPVQSGEIIGNVTHEIQEKLGLSSEAKLVAGLPDTQAALFAANCITPGSLGVVLGSTTPVQAVCDSFFIDPKQRAWTTVISIKNICDRYIVETNNGITGQIVKWAANLFGSESTSTLPEKFDILNKKYKELDTFEQNQPIDLVMDLAVYASLGPSILASTNVETGSGIFKFPFPGGVDEITLDQNSFIGAIYDNILFATMGNIEFARQISNQTQFNYAILGGITRSKTLCQRIADLLSSSINILKSPEATTIGLLLLCDIAEGKINSAEDLKIRLDSLDIIEEIKPRVEMGKKLMMKYKIWQKFKT
jgi:sugar (pentulose or hexulose) kinase